MRQAPDWRGIAAVVLAVGVFVVLAIGAIYGGRNPNYTISTEEIATVATVLGAAIGAIATYLGTGRRPPPGGGGGKDSDAPP